MLPCPRPTGDSLPVNSIRLFQMVSAEVMISPARRRTHGCRAHLQIRDRCLNYVYIYFVYYFKHHDTKQRQGTIARSGRAPSATLPRTKLDGLHHQLPVVHPLQRRPCFLHKVHPWYAAHLAYCLCLPLKLLCSMPLPLVLLSCELWWQEGCRWCRSQEWGGNRGRGRWGGQMEVPFCKPRFAMSCRQPSCPVLYPYYDTVTRRSSKLACYFSACINSLFIQRKTSCCPHGLLSQKPSLNPDFHVSATYGLIYLTTH